MKTFMEPKIEVLAFDVIDIITVSGEDIEQGENEGPIL